MTEALHPLAPHHVPFFISSPDVTDVLMVATGIILLLAVVGIGVFYFKLHSLPEHLAHRGQKIQFELVSVLCLIALFTHNHAFWIAGLLLAIIPLPNFTSPLTSMAQSLGRMAGRGEPVLAPKPLAGPEPVPLTGPEPVPLDEARQHEARRA